MTATRGIRVWNLITGRLNKELLPSPWGLYKRGVQLITAILNPPWVGLSRGHISCQTFSRGTRTHTRTLEIVREIEIEDDIDRDKRKRDEEREIGLRVKERETHSHSENHRWSRLIYLRLGTRTRWKLLTRLTVIERHVNILSAMFRWAPSSSNMDNLTPSDDKQRRHSS